MYTLYGCNVRVCEQGHRIKPTKKKNLKKKTWRPFPFE